ncbi:MAG: hypothetical protein IKR00_01635 [Lachnospiraceae bacterium]|nr:hypothetical protein [Lachnospiraceae bacterium]
MKGVEKITERILAEANEAANAAKSEAEAKAKEILEEFEGKAKQTYEQMVANGRVEAAAAAERKVRTAKLQAKKDILGTKQEFINKAYTIAQESILAMPEDEYVDLLARKACEASISGEEAVILNEDDKSVLGQKVVDAANALLASAGKKASLTLSDETAKMIGGLFLKQNDVSVNCSIDSIIGTFREDLDVKVAKVLFG